MRKQIDLEKILEDKIKEYDVIMDVPQFTASISAMREVVSQAVAKEREWISIDEGLNKKCKCRGGKKGSS